MAARGSGSAGRVIAGTARGIRLAAPGDGTRPLGDRVKQALFAIIEPDVRGRPFLDLFAGSGAAGIEALSRGAERAVFVERDGDAIRALGRNLEATHLGGPPNRVLQAEVRRWLGSGAEGPFAVIVMDPPYDRRELLDDSLRAIADRGPGGLLTDDGVVVAKHFWKDALPARIGLLRSAREERFGETLLTFYRWSDADEGEEVG